MNSTPEIFSLLQVSSTGIWRGFPTTTINSTDRIVITTIITTTAITIMEVIIIILTMVIAI